MPAFPAPSLTLSPARRAASLLGDRVLPDWVRWLAQDASGDWWGYEVEPNQGHLVWYENEVGRYLRLARGEPNPDWQGSLHRRNQPIAKGSDYSHFSPLKE